MSCLTKWDGEEDTEESPQTKNQPKKARTELEMAPTMEAAGAIGKGIGELERAILWWLDQLNAHLATLVELKVEEVWGPRADSDLGADDIRDELMVLKARSMDKEKEVMRKRWAERKKDKKRAKAARETEGQGGREGKGGAGARGAFRGVRSQRERQTPWYK